VGGSINSDSGVDDGSSQDGCTQYRLYTFTVSDSCGNSDTETTRVSREFDMVNPEISDIPDYILEGCNAPWPEFLTTNWMDNCSVGGSINSDAGVDDGTSDDGCTQYRLYTFTMTDSCGNSDIETTRVSKGYQGITDLQDYQLEGCNSVWPPFLTTNWTDSCTEGIDIESDNGVEDGNSEDGCIQYRLYTFTVTDSCGNINMETTQVSREIDITNPEIMNLPDYQLEGCNATWPEFLTTTWTDNCAAGGSINSDTGVEDGSSTDGTIEYRLYTFNVTDNCGNMSTKTTRVAKIIGNGAIVEGGLGELCRKDFPAPNGYNLTILLPDDSPTGGVWSLHSSPDNVEVPISQNASIIPTNLPSGIYEFWYTVGAGVCDLIIKVWVTVLDPENEPCVLPCTSGEVSTAVTPNGDQVNDTFDAGLLIGGGCTVDVQIFNRWGAKIFEAVDYQNDWSCTVHSNAIGSAGKITTGTYYYILQFKIDDKIEQTKTGFFYVATE
jgi:gliding motility-associated-like protein